MPTFLISCGGITYTLFANGTGEKDDIRFNVKHIKDGCCVCSGVLVNSFKNDEIQSQLFVESKNRFLFNSTKFYFPYSINDSLIKVDVMIAVVNTPFQYPVLISTKLRLQKLTALQLYKAHHYIQLEKLKLRPIGIKLHLIITN